MSDRKALKRDVPPVRAGGWHAPVFRKRSAIYIDGFNLYHAVSALERNYLKWLDPLALGRALAPRSEVVRRAVWATAFRPQGRQAVERHQTYHEALKARGVVCLTGHYLITPDQCNACGHSWQVALEKQSDVNLALALADDAHENRFDVAYLVTGDGDHAATARFLKERFPQKRLVAVAPPGRRQNRHILEFADAQIAIDMDHLEQALLPETVHGPNGVIVRPGVYTPPNLPRVKGHLALVSSNE